MASVCSCSNRLCLGSYLVSVLNSAAAAASKPEFLTVRPWKPLHHVTCRGDLSGIPARKVCAADRVGSKFEVPRRIGVLAGAGKSWIDRSNGCTFVIGSVQQRPTKIHPGNVGLTLQGE